jgi:hypothetical protein
MVNRTWRWAALAVVLVAMAVAPSATALGSGSHSTYLTFSRPVQLPGVSLEAGSYIFEVSAPGSDVVQVLTRDRSRAVYQGFTNPAYRSVGKRDATATFGEAAAGSAPPVKAWWPEGDALGHSFIYR